MLCCNPAGDLDGVAYLQKYTTLEHMQSDQVAKLSSDIIYRRLVEVRHHFCAIPLSTLLLLVLAASYTGFVLLTYYMDEAEHSMSEQPSA